MQQMKPWYEDDCFWETAAPVLFSQRRWSDAATEVEDIASLLGISPGARVLDLCCGVGRHSLELARRGFHVTGVDKTAAYLERARRQAKAEGLDVEFVQDDMRAFCRPDAFDAAINLFTSFGYFENPEDDRQVVMNVYRALRASGSFLLDMMGKEVLARIFQERHWHEEEGLIVLQEVAVSENWGWVENRWIIVQDGEKREFKISHRLYSAAELSALLAECGFDGVDVYGDVKGAPYDHTAKRLVVVAHRGDSK
jgi:SAM-dependent methyltransferase